uniref:Uncharacterized protein n=1 Tax=Grammatophora oceanica TaxID=210454 RepID=A0A7S1Y1J5_9STRA|mmetsp:Transcript_18161/g.26967  ORF Transcript_18161/g.26967 Transcript_18161/m.26967 type:complete len:447 (+) Transcript_18161:84-1424(+)
MSAARGTTKSNEFIGSFDSGRQTPRCAGLETTMTEEYTVEVLRAPPKVQLDPRAGATRLDMRNTPTEQLEEGGYPQTRLSSPGAFHSRNARALGAVYEDDNGSSLGRRQEQPYSSHVFETGDDDGGMGNIESVTEGKVIANLDHVEDDDGGLFRRRLSLIVLVFIILLVATSFGTYFAVRSKSRSDSVVRPREDGRTDSPTTTPTASPVSTLQGTSIPWTEVLGTPLVGSPSQQFGASVIFAGDVLAVKSNGGTGLLQFFQFDNETGTSQEIGLPIELGAENPEQVCIKMSSDGRYLAIAFPSDNIFRMGKVHVYSGNFGEQWALKAEIIGEQPSFGASLGISEDGGRLVVASGTAVRAYDLTADPPLQLGNSIPILPWTGTGYPIIVSITASLLGIGQVQRPCITEWNGDLCEDLGLVAFYMLNGGNWEDAPPWGIENTLSNSGP